MNKIYLVNRIYSYSESSIVRYHYAYKNIEDAKEKFDSIREDIIKTLIDCTESNSYDDLIDNHIELTHDTSSLFGYLWEDGSEELELSIDELEVL